MAWIIIAVLLLIVIAVGIVVVVDAQPNTDQQITGWLMVGVAAVFLLVFTGVRSFGHTIAAGHVGLVYKFGKLDGQTGSGQQELWPWESIKSANIQSQKAVFSLDSFSEETQNVYITATLNYQVGAGDVQNLYRTVGPDYFNTLVPQRVAQAFKDETVKFKAVEIAPHRSQIRQEVLEQLKADLKPFSIQATALNIDNISFSKAFTQAIEDKQIATQQAQAAQNRVAVAKYQAQQIIETAEGQAKANTLKRQTLTPLLVEQNAIDKLNPNVQVIMVPSGSNFLLPNLLPDTSSTGSTHP